jgi:2-keto-4-pentenoate hydratase/2-oxohepta-3-ene-1,7-dioic acid hydratase in catechol pathway
LDGSVKLVRYRRQGGVGLGEVSGPEVRELLFAGPDQAGADLVVRHIEGEGSPGAVWALDEVEMLSPVARPSKILCIGLNYLDHVRETGAEVPPSPVLFAKYPNSLVGHGQQIRLERANSNQVDFEAELATVIGRRCRNVTEPDALGYVFGYTAANDVSARDAQFENSQWVRGKSFDTFCPLGPWVVTADELGNPQDLSVRCWVGDTLYQDGRTSDMIFGVAYLVSYLSRTMTLEPGDLLLTGTPWGVGFTRTPPVFLNDGDVVRIAIDRIGELINPVAVVP